MERPDTNLDSDIAEAMEPTGPQVGRMLLLTSIAIVVIGLTWAHFAILEEVTSGSGRVIPSQQIQFVQSLEGGIVEKILVEEGDVVQRGQPLIRIRDVAFAAELGEVRERRNALAARIVRLEAESKGRSTVRFGDVIQPQYAALESNAFDARAHKLVQELNVLRQQELRLTDTLRILDRELDLTQNLAKQKVVPELDMLRLYRQLSEMRGQLAETKSKIEYATAAFRSQAEEDLVKSVADLAVLDETIKSAQDRLRRTELNAPVYGIVNNINVTTVGAVVRSAATLMEIVPLDDTLLVESQIRPRDIAFIRPQQDARVKVTAYDPATYGSLKGWVERISADTIVDETGRGKNEMFYRVIIRTEKSHLGTIDKKLQVIPGMVTTVDILTGNKSVLDYLLKPIRVLRDTALRER